MSHVSSIVAIGEIVVDWLSVTPGATRLNAVRFARYLGGNAANVAIAARRLGSSVKLIAKVGADFQAQFLKNVLIKEDIPLDYIFVDEQHPTAQCYVFTDDHGGHHFYNWPDANAATQLKAKDVRAEQLAGGRFLHATGISLICEPRRSAIDKAINLATEAGMIISFDAGYPIGEDQVTLTATESCLARSHILKVNLQELIYWSGGDGTKSPKDLALELFHRYRPIVLAATLSANGCLLVTDKGLVNCPGYQVYSVDEVGAGDAFTAGLMYAIDQRLDGLSNPDKLAELSTRDWQRIGSFANAVGARACERLGAIDGLPTLPDVLALQKELR